MFEQIKNTLLEEDEIVSKVDLEFSEEFDLLNKKERDQKIKQEIDYAIFILSEENINDFLEFMFSTGNKKPIFFHIHNAENISNKCSSLSGGSQNSFQIKNCNTETAIIEVKNFIEEEKKYHEFMNDFQINISSTISSKMNEFIEDIMKMDGITKSYFIRKLILDYWKRNKDRLKKWKKINFLVDNSRKTPSSY